MEQQYVLRNTPRIEPQGEEDFAESPSVSNENSSKSHTHTQLHTYNITAFVFADH